jgi:mRNA interferase RelE/StbE
VIYRIEFAPRAARQFEALPQAVKSRMRPRIEALAKNPRPPGAKRLQGKVPYLRIRAGDYRVVYHIRDDRLLVLIVMVGHRREVYR